MAFLFTIDIGKSWKKIEHIGSQADNGRKMAKMGCRVKMAGNGFPRVIRRGSQVDNGRKWQKWPKMVEKSSPRLFGRKWIFARFLLWTSR